MTLLSLIVSSLLPSGARRSCQVGPHSSDERDPANRQPASRSARNLGEAIDELVDGAGFDAVPTQESRRAAMLPLEMLDRGDHVFGPTVDLDGTGTPVIEAGPAAIRRVTGGGQGVIRGHDLDRNADDAQEQPDGHPRPVDPTGPADDRREPVGCQ